ncbi:MAG: SAM-dependent methyltransferase [bacterium]
MLMNALRLLMFSLLLIAFLPLVLLGALGFMIRLKTRNRGISGTAYEPFVNRLLFHHAGTRDDAAAVRLAPHLPALSPTVAWLLIGTMGLAARLSGYQGSFLSYPGARPSSMISMMVHRTAFFDEALASAVDPTAPHPAQQVVFLGAGWDTRAFGALRDRPVRVFEVDTPATQRVKRQALDRAGIDASHVTFVETDFGQTSWFDALLGRGFDPDLPTFILWEGVTYYLDEKTVQTTLRTVSGLAVGSRIAFDTYSREFFFGFLGQYMCLMVKGFYGESWQFFLSTAAPARKQASDFIASQGLALAGYEPLGEERGKSVPVGGFTLAERSG